MSTGQLTAAGQLIPLVIGTFLSTSALLALVQNIVTGFQACLSRTRTRTRRQRQSENWLELANSRLSHRLSNSSMQLAEGPRQAPLDNPLVNSESHVGV